MAQPNTLRDFAEMTDHTAPINIQVMDVDQFIRLGGYEQVKSFAIKQPSSIEFHPEGLFSEKIFGQIGTTSRITSFGWISLPVRIIAPVVFKAISKLSALYLDIMAGRAFAKWDNVRKDFIKAHEDDPDADTGYTFFLSHFKEIDYPITPSMSRDDRIQLSKKYIDICLYDKIPVMPAGLRDVEEVNGRMTQDEINKLYISVMAYSMSIPIGTNNAIYDSIRFNLQMKVMDIYTYIENILDGKRGFFQSSLTKRSIALGTRNVITGVDYASASPDDPQSLRPNEVMCGLYQTMGGCAPKVANYFKRIFIDPILGDGEAVNIALTNPKTFTLEYSNVAASEIQRFNSIDAIKKWINKFVNKELRTKPIMIKDMQGMYKSLCLVYDDDDEITLCRSINDLKEYMPNADISKLRPITWVEAFYLVTANATMNVHAFVTRYPVTEDGSVVPAKVHVATTSPARLVKVRDLLGGGGTVEYPQYPIRGNTYIDSTVPYADKLGGLGGDFDGDTVSVDYILSNEGNEEVAKYIDSYKNYISPELSLFTGGATDIIRLTYRYMSINNANDDAPLILASDLIPYKLITE